MPVLEQKEPAEKSLIKDGAVVADDWTLLPKDFEGELPEGQVIIPLAYWQKNRSALLERPALGLWLDSDEEVETVAEDLPHFRVIGVNFPVFSDGRGFSTARLLRERYGYAGEVRAIGQAIRDQLFYLKRCGFNAFQLREGTDLEAALASLADFSDSYQTAADQPEPLFRRR